MVARASTKAADSRRAERRAPASSRIGTRTMRPMGMWTARGWRRPTNCSQSACGVPLSVTINGRRMRAALRARAPIRSDGETLAGEASLAGRHAGELLAAADGVGDVLVIESGEVGFVIEHVN